MNSGGLESGGGGFFLWKTNKLGLKENNLNHYDCDESMNNLSKATNKQ